MTYSSEIAIELLTDNEFSQLLPLENEYLAEIGEDTLTEKKRVALKNAVCDGRITFFIAKLDGRPVGMCSVVCSFSTFSCSDIGIFEDFFVLPEFRKRGIARRLVIAAQTWSRSQNLASLTVCCAPCDEPMYQALGFDVQLGNTFAKINRSDG